VGLVSAFVEGVEMALVLEFVRSFIRLKNRARFFAA